MPRTSPPKPKLTAAERHKRFVETAEKVEASESLEEFDKAFSRLNIRATMSVPDTPRHKRQR